MRACLEFGRLNLILLQKQDAIEDLGEVDFENPQIIVVAKEFSPEQREILGLMSDYLRLFRYQLYEGGLISLEEVEALGSTALTKTRDGHGTALGAYGINHFGMKSEVAKVYERLDKGITSLDSRIKPGKINKYFIGYGATGSYFCLLKPRVHFVRVEVKCHRRPPRLKALKIRKLSDYRTFTYSLMLVPLRKECVACKGTGQVKAVGSMILSTEQSRLWTGMVDLKDSH
jgi:hypothetical protein